METKEYCPDCGCDPCDKCLGVPSDDAIPCDVIDFHSYLYDNVIVYIYKNDDKVA